MRHSAMPWYKRLIVVSVIVSLLSSYLPMVQITEALVQIQTSDSVSTLNPGGGLEEIKSVDSVETKYGLVAILVDENTWKASASSRGGFSFLGNTDIDKKIKTYAEDIQSTLPWTKTVILTVGEDDTPVEIQRTLERFYYEGNPQDDDLTQLSGVVTVGDVPLPVVNKKGHRFISMLPYTDFEEPSYILDPDTMDFVPNNMAQNLQTEVWHGVIVPPVDGQDGIDLLAYFFDKNHSFHEGEDEYTKFNEKVFLGDFVTEERTINSVSFASYQRFLDLWEEIVYYRYTNDLVEEMYTQLIDEATPGDNLDNDFDGLYDEEAEDGIDNDGDGLVDEDIGDGFFGIDNDSDCLELPEESRDSNGDGYDCSGGELDENGDWIVEPDYLVDEDGFEDNNNDKDWVMDLYREGGADLFEDRMIDEDPPGDTTGGPDEDGDGIPDGDGCPGLCGVDDNGDAIDHDGDGYPTGWEIMHGYDPFNEKRPFKRVSKMVNGDSFYADTFGFEVDTSSDTADAEATAFLQSLFVDQFFGGTYQHPSCFAEDGSYHPEWDDDEDGFCDEDGSTQNRLWADDQGTPYSGECAYNDADCDGLLDEDPIGMQPVNSFDLLPDLQAKDITESMINKYMEIFDQPLGVMNRIISGTGRYDVRDTNSEDIITNDYDSSVSLIAKKDEMTLRYLYDLNTALEDKVDEIVTEELEEPITMVAVMRIAGEVTYDDDDDADTEDIVDDICTTGKNPDLTNSACLQFVNHSTVSEGKKYEDYEGGLFEGSKSNNIHVNGLSLWDIETPADCTLAAGTNEEDGQMVEFNALYSQEYANLSKGDIQERTNCVPDYQTYIDDIPQLCDTPIARADVKALSGAKEFDEDFDFSRLDTGFGACYEFREMTTFEVYEENTYKFNKWLTKQIRRFRKNDGGDEDDYEEFLDNISNELDTYDDRPGELTLRKHFSELDMLSEQDDMTYTMVDFLKDKGWDNPDDEDIDIYLALNDSATVSNPSHGSGMSNVKKVELNFDKTYLEADSLNNRGSKGKFTTNRDDAWSITSVYKHVQPDGDTLNAQVANIGTPNLPIDATRRITFQDKANKPAEIVYPNIFDAEDLDDVNNLMDGLVEDFENVAGGGAFVSDVEAIMDGVNEDELKDALAWRAMNIDQKHDYLFTHYLGEDEPLWSKARDGYEIVSLIADGSATEMQYAFNGEGKNIDDDEADAMKEQAAELKEAVDELAAAQENVDVFQIETVGLADWMIAVQEWLKELSSSLTNFGVFEGETVCGGDFDFTADTTDADNDGTPDVVDDTVSLRLTTDDNNVLQAGGGGSDYFVVSVSARKADGTVNTEDSYTNVELEIYSEVGVVEIIGNPILQLTGGVANYALLGGEPGTFTLSANARDGSEATDSNTLEGSVTSKLVKVTTYVTENTLSEAEVVDSDQIEVYDNDGEIVAILDPKTGDLELRGVEAELREATSELPTRVAIVSDEGETYGVFFIIPDTKRVTIGDGIAGVFVEEEDAAAEANSGDEGVELYMDGTQIGLVTDHGQIAVSDGYYLEFSNPEEVNIYDPMLILDSRATTLFSVKIKHNFENAEDFVSPEDEGYNDYLGWMKKWLNPLALAEVVIPDTDGDLLDDMEEYTIGTDLYDEDTDGDDFSDGEEIFSGFDPLAEGEVLFTDIDPSNEAYYSLVVLYVRGVIKGYSDGSFKPDNPMTREEFVKVNLGAICVTCDSFSGEYEDTLFSEYDLNPFPDTDINDDLLACVAEAKDREIVSGYDGGEYDGYFLPTKNISRAEATKVLVETAGLEVEEAAEDEVWYAGYIRTAQTYSLFPDTSYDASEVTDEDFKAWLEGSITRAEFVMMAVNLIDAQDCRATDNDEDGLSNVEEELVYGTDPDNADTDEGGVSDFDEVIRGSDPLNASDDFPDESTADDDGGGGDGGNDYDEFAGLGDYEHEPGLYAVSDQVDYGKISVSGDSENNNINVFTTETPADGEAELFVRAEIRDQSGNVYTDDDTSVIEFILSTEDYGVIESKKVQVSGGQAETSFVSTIVSGKVDIEALITDGSLPSQNALVTVYPGEAVSTGVQAESEVLPAGGEAVTDMNVYMYDIFGNLANFGFYTVTIESDSGVEILDLYDEDSETDGYQVTTSDGFVNFRLLSGLDAGIATVSASILDIPESGSQLEIENIDGMQMQVSTTESYMFAGSSGTQTINVEVTDSYGAVIDDYNGEVTMSLSDDSYGTFSEDTIQLAYGEGSTTLMAGTLAGVGSVIAESPGIQSGSTSLTIKPDEVAELKIRKDDGTDVLQAGERVRFYIEGYDMFGNLVDTDSSITGTIRTTDVTKSYGTLSSETFTLNQGVANFDVAVEDLSGTLNLIAASGSLVPGVWEGDIKYSISGEEFANINPQMLYGSVLGAAYGDVTEENYIAGWMTFNGTTQAVTSLISEPIPKKRLISIDANGSISLPEDSFITQNVKSAGSSLPTRIQWKAYPDETLYGEVFYVIPNSSGAVSTELVSNRLNIELEEGSDDSILLREDSAAVAKVRKDGQIVILDSNYVVAVNGAAEGLGFVVLRGTEPIMLVNFETEWKEEVTVLDADYDIENWVSESAGIYLRPTSAYANDLVRIPSGNSSLNAKGIALIDPETDLPDEMQPSMGYESIDRADSNGNIGWEDENKHLLLFSAGNTVGESNLYYSSEVGVVLGDPSISLPTPNEENEIGFTDDIGTMVSAGQDEILQLMDIDYNNDGQMDVIAAYEDGRIEVLQNYNAAVRLQERGTLLFVENGISSIDKGDFNGDGMTDMVVVTEESCYADEMCLYIYENIGGGFTAQNITLDGVGKPTQVVAEDLNNDGYDELVLVDENMKLYVVWNAEGTLETVDMIRDFGLDADPSADLSADVVLRYDDLENGSVELPILTTELTTSPSVDGDLQEFLDDLELDKDINVSIDNQDLEGGEEVTKRVAVPFEYADNASVDDIFEVSKSMDDSNGDKLEVGDVLNFEITVKNVSGSNYSDFYLADSVPSTYTYDSDSFDCNGCDLETTSGDSKRPWQLGPLSLANGESITVNYNASLKSLPSLSVMVAQDIYDDYKDDNYADIAVSLEGNTSGQLMVYYSDGYITESKGGILGIGGTSYRRISFQEKEYSPDNNVEYEEEAKIESPLEDSDENGVPDLVEQMSSDNGVPVANSGFDAAKEMFGAVDENGDGYYSSDEMFKNDDDQDNDGIVDTIDLWVSENKLLIDPDLDLDGDETVMLSSEDNPLELKIDAEISAYDDEVEAIAQKIEEVVSMFTCDGGCLAIPGSIAFLAPGTYHDPFSGTTVGFDPGTPILGILGYPPVLCIGQSCYGSLVFRMYLAPTTTLGIGLGLCVGPYGTPNCFAFNIPLLQALGICDAINGFIADSLSKATDFVSDGVNAAFNLEDPGGYGVSGSSNDGVESSIFEDYHAPVDKNMNIQISGFPSKFTEWWKAQKYEFFKMLDLPDITIIYPDPASMVNEFRVKQNNQANQEAGSVDLTTETRIKVLNSGIMGLEKFLNFAHSLPLIDINPEPVYIRYPAITNEEIDIAKRDFELWIQNTKDEWERFKYDFSLRDDVSDDEQEMYNELEDTINELIAGFEANVAALESYGQIPEEILKLRNLQAYYAKVIICYLDAILSFTADYLKENVDAIEGWAQFLQDLKQTIKGWQLLLDLGVKLMDSCDKCTNARWSGLQLIFSLFLFIPDIPVIEMPKLPDIVIDTSNIQAGVDVVWPDLKFVPERIDIPDLPRISLPSAYLNLDVDVDIKVPVLPEFPILLELPELPGLPLPSLPTLPPAPKVPELDPALKASLSIASDILKVVCLIRSGFIPVPEMTLKSKIEDITERPGGIVMPFDLASEVEWPEFTLDFWKTIEINTYLNLTADFTVLYDVIKDYGDQSNEVVGDVVDILNDTMQDVANKIKNVINVDIELGLDASVEGSASADGVEGDADAKVDDEAYQNNPAYQIANTYINHPLVKENLVAFGQVMETLAGEFKAWDDTMPESYDLVATQRILAEDDPLLHRYDEIIDGGVDLDTDFLASIEGTPLSSVAVIRESMIAYVDDLEKGTERLGNMDSDGFQRYLAQENITSQYLLASDEGEDSYSTADAYDPESLAVPKDEVEVILSSESTDSLEGMELGAGQTESFLEGFYIYNSELGVSTKLMEYSQESDSKINILFIDYDDDGDDDIVYSMGGDIYMKDNYTKSPTLKYVSSDPDTYELADVTPDHGNVKNFARGRNDNEEASFSFDASDTAVGYDVMLYDSIDAQQSEPDENIKRTLLLDNLQNPSISFYDDEGNEYGRGSPMTGDESSSTVYYGADDMSILLPKVYEYDTPDVRQSRVVVADYGGDTVLYNGYLRTVVSSNGEIGTVEDVLLQTLEKTLIKLEQDGETVNIELPAQTWIRFGRGSEDRVIRVDSGEAIWIEENETVEEQELIEGMEIFEEEIISLESNGADVLLRTSEGAELTLDNEEVFVIDRLANASSPSSKMTIDNGAYYTVMKGIYSDGTIGTLSDNILLNPQVCADRSDPYPIINVDSSGDDGNGLGGGGEIDLAIFSTREISAENSFDSGSDIVDAYWDLDITEDADGDGIYDNDAQVIGLTAEIGPYEDVDQKEVTLTITDTAGNTASANVYVNIYVPDITLTDATTQSLSGTTDPSSPEFPFDLVREREGALTELGESYLTDMDGEILIDDFESSDLISVYDIDNEVIAEYNPETKQLITYDPAYAAGALPSGDGWPSRLVVYDIATGKIVASVLFVGDSELYLTEFDTPLDESLLGSQESVTVYAAGENTEVTETAAYVRNIYGSTKAQVTQDGNITIFDDSYKLVKRYADSLEEYLVLEIYNGDGDLEMQVWPGTPDEVTITTTDLLGLDSSKSYYGDGGNANADYRLYFEDIEDDDPLYDDIAELVERNVIEGYTYDDLQYFLPNQEITRAEFTKIVLGILCIIPSDEAYELPEVFNDILDTALWYFPFTKESNIRELITGYLGEIDLDGLAPFKPDNTITRAEAAKIILEALDKEAIIELPGDLEGEPWYEPYVDIAQDLGPYLVDEGTAGSENYILTESEAADPNHIITRYEFVEMTARVLQAYNCFDLDSDGDGLVNFDEETIYGTDPYNPDSDEGGIDDGTEMNRETDPLDVNDDYDSGVGLDVDPGVYVVREACISCPCDSNIDYAADLKAGDSIFAIMRNAAGKVFGISNTLPISD